MTEREEIGGTDQRSERHCDAARKLFEGPFERKGSRLAASWQKVATGERGLCARCYAIMSS
jgi:hypothetical protein